MKRTAVICALLLVLSSLAALTPKTWAGADQEQNIEQMVANAKTPADHQAIATYYDREATEYKSKAEFHRKLANTYKSLHLKPTDTVHHCEEMAKDFDTLAKDASALAKAHRKMASQAK